MKPKFSLSTVRSKMLFSLFFIVSCFLIGFVVIYVLLGHIQSQTEEMEHWNTYALKSQETSSTFQQKYIFVTDLQFQEDPDFDVYHSIDERMEALMSELEAQIDSEEASYALEQLRFYNDMFDTRVNQYITLEIVPSELTLQGFGYLNDEMRSHAGELENYFTAQAETANQNVESAMQNAVVFSIIIAVAASIIGSVIFLSFSRRIQTQIRDISNTAKEVSSGNLHVKPLAIRGKDELAQLSKEINAMTEQLREIMREMSNASQSIAASSEELVASSEEVNAGSEEVSSSVQEIADIQADLDTSINRSNDTFQVMGSELQEVYSAVQEIVTESERSNDQAQVGQKRLDDSISSMREIRIQNEANATTINALGSASQEIQHVVTLIKEISGQTSLLALNANIEAARAGKAGKGFAVVADEVRKLAAESEDAAHSITETISKMTENVHDSVEQSKESTTLITSGEQMLTEMSKTYQLILNAFQAVTKKSEMIDALVKQVTENSNQIIQNLDSVQDTSKHATTNSASIAATVEQQVATMDSISDAAQELAEIANDLDTRMSHFKI